MKTVLCGFAVAALALASAPASPKSQTIKIEISGASLATPLEITDAGILDQFSIWNGPGVRINAQPVHMEADNQERIGAFIDWPRGKVPMKPFGLQRYDVIFHQGGREPMHDWHRRYVVRYEYEPSTEGGYIHLPGPNEGDDYERNVFSIGHGVEGSWFHSSAAWERLVRPLIEKAVAAGRPD
jgi:hypothetical protein